jgi:5-methyltetrahydropteroyltriglutamate--homocysteine methyltransferase
LATRRDAGTELAYAAELINQVVDGVRGVRLGLHVCRGNWSRDESVLLAGDYSRLVPAFQRMNVHQYVLEYASPRAGEIDVVGRALGGRELGLGVVNPRTAEVETPGEIVRRAEQALAYFPARSIFLNPDCGFGCFANRCVNDEATATAKLAAIVRAAEHLRQHVG